MQLPASLSWNTRLLQPLPLLEVAVHVPAAVPAAALGLLIHSKQQVLH